MRVRLAVAVHPCLHPREETSVERAEGRPDPEAVGIVLAGGRATRLGAVAASGKAWLELDGRTFLERVCAAVAPEVAAVVVVAADGADLPPVPGATVVRDTVPSAGPLAAIRDGIRAAVAAGSPPARRFVVVSCDVPLVRPEMIRLLLTAAREGVGGEKGAAAPTGADVLWTLPVAHGHLQVLVSVFDVRMLSRLESWLAAGRRDPRGLATSLLADEPSAVRLVDEPLLATADPTLASFMDVDTPEDLRRLASS
jgi:molybdopterin-guanine dinucleotide biosynthesis protein A